MRRTPSGSVLTLHAACVLAAAACASAADPPGGPPDPSPPAVLRVNPESGSVLAEPPRAVEIIFDEVISERISGPRQNIAGAVILSPVDGETRVAWRRNRLEVRPREGFQPGRVYHLQLLPVVRDLRDNRLPRGRVVVFSTGPALPNARLSGTLVDWTGGRAAVNGLIEAVSLPDSLPYRTLTDSSGEFSFPPLPPGEYLVWGVLDQDGDRNRGPREAFDTARVVLDSAARAELFAFVHDTVGPRIRQMEATDSVTVRVQFDRPIHPAHVIQPAHVMIVSGDGDSTIGVPVAAVLTQRQLDSARASSAAARDSGVGRDTLAARAAPRPSPAPTAGGVRPAPGGPPVQRDSTRAMRMLAARPQPTDLRFIRLAEPLQPDRRYTVTIDSVRGLAGAVGAARPAQLRPPRQRAGPPLRRAPADTAARDTASTRP